VRGSGGEKKLVKSLFTGGKESSNSTTKGEKDERPVINKKETVEAGAPRQQGFGRTRRYEEREKKGAVSRKKGGGNTPINFLPSEKGGILRNKQEHRSQKLKRREERKSPKQKRRKRIQPPNPRPEKKKKKGAVVFRKAKKERD